MDNFPIPYMVQKIVSSRAFMVYLQIPDREKKPQFSAPEIQAG
jgi:hypothetical protein